MDEDDRIDEILGDWRARRDAGERVEPDDVLAAHPEHAAALRACFAALRLLPDVGAARTGPPPLRAMPEGRYAGFRPAGEGGMGIVYWALDADLGREVAFKVVRPAASAGGSAAPTEPLELTPPDTATPDSKAFEALRARFLREARITAALEHPGVVPVYDLGETPEGVPYYTMRFVRGNRTLAQAIAETPPGARLRLLDPFLKVCDTLRYAHARGVMHRDLKPANIALGEYGEVVVIDWGLAREHGSPVTTDDALPLIEPLLAGTPVPRTAIGPVGTPGYMSPEAARGRAQDVDEKSDVYSLGAILFEILAGRPPFQRTTLEELLHDLVHSDPQDPVELAPTSPPELGRICLRALARERDERFASVDEFAAAIRDWQARSEREARIAAARDAAREGVELARRLGPETPILQLAATSHACRNVLEMVPGDEEMTRATADLTAIHGDVVSKQVRRARTRALRRVGIATLGGALVAAAGVAALLDARRRETEIERDGKAQALDRERVQRHARERALRSAEGLRLTLEAQALVQQEPTLALLLALEGLDRRRDLRATAVLLDALAACREEKTLETGSVGGYGGWLSADGTRAAAVDAEHSVHVWEMPSARPLAVLRGHSDTVHRVEFDASGARAATSSDDGTAVVWDVATGARAAVLRGHEKPVVWAEFSPDGRTIATASQDGTARLWDAATGAARFTLRHDGRVREARFDAAGARLLTASEDRAARTWDVASGGLLTTLKGHTARVLAAQWSADGRSVVTNSDDKTARVWDAATGAPRVVLSGHSGLVITACFSSDGAQVLTASWDGTARLWNTATGAELRRLDQSDGLSAAKFSPDGRRIVTGGTWARETRVWNAEDGLLLAVLHGAVSSYGEACLTPDGRHLLTGGEDGVARWWDLARPAPIVRIDSGENGAARSAALSPDGRLAAVVTISGRLRVWNATTGEPVAFDAPETADLAAFSSASDRIAVAATDGVVEVRDAASGALVARLAAHAGHARSLEFAPDGKSLLTAGDDGAARLWDAATGARLVEFAGGEKRAVHARFVGRGARVAWFDAAKFAVVPAAGGEPLLGGAAREGNIVDVAESPDARRVVVSVSRGPTTLWDAATKRLVAEIGRQDGICRAAFSPDGERVATAGAPGEIRVVSAASGRPLLSPAGHLSHIASLGYSPDGRFLVSTSTDEHARVWDAAGGEPVLEFPGGDGWVLGASMSEDGARMLTWTQHGKLEVAPVDVVAAARRAKPRELSAQEEARFGLGPRAETGLLLDGAKAALAAGRAEQALVLARGALAEAAEGAPEDGMLRYVVACAELLRAAEDEERRSAHVASALESLSMAVAKGVDPVDLADRGAPDVGDPDVLDRLGAARAAVEAAITKAEKATPLEVDQWLVEAADAASRGRTGAAIGRYRRAFAADRKRCAGACLQLARLYGVRAGTETDPARRADLARVLDWLEESAKSGVAPSSADLAAPEFAPLRDEPRFRALAGR